MHGNVQYMYNCTCIVHYQDEIRPSDDARPLALSRPLLTVHTKEYCREKHICRVNTFLYSVINTKLKLLLAEIQQNCSFKSEPCEKYKKICLWGWCKPQLLIGSCVDQYFVNYCLIFLVGGLESVGHSFVYVVHLYILRDVWIGTQRGRGRGIYRLHRNRRRFGLIKKTHWGASNSLSALSW